jgi:hypothetical protein
LNFKGTWNASTNTPTIVSGVGVKGDYFVVSVAGSTTIDGISNWGVGDWITYNGTVWQRVEGGADLNGVNLSVSGTTTLSGLTASTALALNASKEIVSVTNTGTGDNVLATTPTLVGDVTLSTGNLVVADTKGIDFSATPGTGTSELLADYEEGNWTPGADDASGNLFTADIAIGRYSKVGNKVTANCYFTWTSKGSVGAGPMAITGLPFASNSTSNFSQAVTIGRASGFDTVVGTVQLAANTLANSTRINLLQITDNAGFNYLAANSCSNTGGISVSISYIV